MPNRPRYPRAQAKDGAIDRAIERQGRKTGWVAAQSGVSAVHLANIRHGLSIPLERAQQIAKVLGHKVEELFVVHRAPPAQEGRAS